MSTFRSHKHSQSPCALTDPRGGVVTDPRGDHFLGNWHYPVLLTLFDPRGGQFRGSVAQFKSDAV